MDDEHESLMSNITSEWLIGTSESKTQINKNRTSSKLRHDIYFTNNNVKEPQTKLRKNLYPRIFKK